MSWQSLERRRPRPGAWAPLGGSGLPRLQPVPDGYAATRESLRRLAVFVLAPARKAVNGKIGLRYTFGGFGTPFFGDDEQVRVAGGDAGAPRWRHRRGAVSRPLAAAGRRHRWSPDRRPRVGADRPRSTTPTLPSPSTRSAAAASAPGSVRGLRPGGAPGRTPEPSAGPVAGAALARALRPRLQRRRGGLWLLPGGRLLPRANVYVGPWTMDGLDGWSGMPRSVLRSTSRGSWPPGTSVRPPSPSCGAAPNWRS